MAHLSLSLLGSFHVTLDGQPITGFKSNKARALLAYLAVEADRPHRRETLAGLLWPDYPDRDAFGNLRFTLSNLRQVISDQRAHPPFLHVTRDTLQFNSSSDHWLDVGTFTRQVEVDRASPTAVNQIKEAVDLYKGSFFEGFSVSDSPAFEDWMLYVREQLARQVLSACHFLAAHFEQIHDYKQAQAFAARQLELEPWEESAHQQMMRILALSGQRSAALAQYQTCTRLLATEFKVEPDQETTRLYEQIRDGKLKAASPPVNLSASPPSVLPSFLMEEAIQTEPPLFVTRERELFQLDGFLKQALSGNGRIVFVTGEAGSGKTSLLQEFALRAEMTHPDLVIASGNCNAYTGIGDPYLPFREILELLSGDVEAKIAARAVTRETARRLWQILPCAVRALVESGPDLIDTFLSRTNLLERSRKCATGGEDWFDDLMGLLERKPSISFLPPTPQQGNLFEQYTRVVTSLAQSNPLLLVIDDLQWADLGSISLLFHLGRHLTGDRILIVGAYRPEEVALEKEGKRHALEPLVNEFRRDFGEIEINVDQAEGHGFINAFLNSEPNKLGPSFREMLFRQTRGHPLFTIELLHGLQERGDLIKDADGEWIEGLSLDWETLPARVEAAIRERITRMPDQLRHVLAVACVEGEQFTAELVARVRGISEQEILDCLSKELDRRHRLVRAQSIRRFDGQVLSSYRFRHILFQKYLYGDLDEVERAHLHEQVGTILEELYGSSEQSTAIAVQLALHFQKAGITSKALHYLHQAGLKAVQLSAYMESRGLLTKAMELLTTLPDSPLRTEQELVLQLAIGMAWMGDIPGPEWEKAIMRARVLCQQTGKISELGHTLGHVSIFHYVKAEYQKATNLAEETLEIFKTSGDPLLVALGHWHLGFILTGRGEFSVAREHLEQVISTYDYQQHHQPFIRLRGSDAGISALAYQACCLWCLGYPDQGRKLSQDTLTLARKLDHAFTSADVFTFGGCLFHAMNRDANAQKRIAEELMNLSSGMGFSSFGGTGLAYLGDALIRMGQIQEGMEKILEGMMARQSIGSVCFQSGFLVTMSEAEVRLGNKEKGMTILTEAFEFINRTGERFFEAELHRIKGELFWSQEKESEAETSFLTAIEVARRQQARMWELRSSISLSRLWQKQGKNKQAKKMLSEIYGWFTEGFDTPDLIEARNLLEELSP